MLQHSVASRADLRESNERDFAGFDARLEQGLAAFDAKLERQKAEIIKWICALWAPIALWAIASAFGVVSLVVRN